MPKRNTEPALWQQKCAEWTRRVIEAMYPLCYWLGIQTIRLWHQLLRALTRVLTPWKRLVRNLWMRYVWQHVRHWGEEWKRFIDGFPLSARLISEAWKRHPLEGIWQVIRTPFLGIRRHRKGLLTVLNIAAPLLALWLAIAAISYWGNATYALQLEYKGENLGYISDESVFDEAATLAEGRVSRVDNSFAIERTPVLTVTLAQEDALLNETELCDIILQSYGNAVEKSSGLYVNDTFVGTVSSPQKAQALLQAILDSHRKNTYESDEISFMQKVELVEGLYPASTRLSLAELRKLLTDRSASETRYTVQEGDSLSSIAAQHDLTARQLSQMNDGLSVTDIEPGRELVVGEAYAYLDVQIVRIEKTNETIPYDTETVEDPNRYIGDNYIKVYGQDGVRTYTDRVVYLDGVEISRQNVSVDVTKHPITEIYAVGAYRVTDAGPGVATGKLIWPVPSSYYISTYWWGYSGHRGLDIVSYHGAPILACDGGVVVDVNYSGWGSGWGSYVLIDHGNGYMTRYAHLSSVHVNYGEYITQGQMIGRMGNTGLSYGTHLHIEVLRYGVRVDPYPFLEWNLY